MLMEGRTGVVSIGDGLQVPTRLGNSGAQLVTELDARYYELAKRGFMYMACLQSAVALSTLNATATGFILTNPVGSAKNLVLIDIAIALATAPGGISNLHLEWGAFSTTAVTQTTPLTVRNALLGNGAGVGLAASAATLPAAPVAIRAIGGGPVATGSVTSGYMTDIIDGKLVLPPGQSLNLGFITTAISVIASMQWAELPVGL